MAFDRQAGRPFQQAEYDNPSSGYPSSSDESQFDIFEWYPLFQSCHRYFLDHAQHSPPVQALAAFVNIALPCHRPQHPIASSTQAAGRPNPQSVSLIPYIRRLVVTGFDTPATLHGMFGDDWQEGIGRLHEVERRNYLFASKSANWLEVKANYDMSPNETIPFMKPLQAATEKEIVAAEAKWSEWLAMQDWMVGPRALDVSDTMESSPGVSSPPIKRES